MVQSARPLVLVILSSAWTSWCSDATTFDVTAYGAVGDGVQSDTHAIRAATLALATAGGGILWFPPNLTFLTGPFNLSSHTVLRISRNTTILASTDGNEWPLLTVSEVWRWFGQARDANPGTEAARLMHQPFVFAWHAVNITIDGGGTVDGQGHVWWACDSRCNRSLPAGRDFQPPPCRGHARPHLLFLSNVSDVRVYDVVARNSGDWTLHFGWVTNLHVRGVRVFAPPPEHDCNQDGIDLDAVQNALIEDCYFDVADDAICVKSGIDWFGRQFGRPSRDILVRRVHIEHGAGPTIGSEMSGSVFNVTFEGFTLHRSELGPNLKSALGRGGVVRGVTWRNITGSSVGAIHHSPLPMVKINMNYFDEKPVPANETSIPQISDLLFEDIHFAAGPGYATSLVGLPQRPVENVTFRNVEFPPGAAFQKCEYVQGTCVNSSRCPPCFGHSGSPTNGHLSGPVNQTAFLGPRELTA